MSQNKMLPIIVMLSALLSLSCTRTTEIEKTNTLQPLEIENYWEYYLSTNESVLRYTAEEILELQVDGEINKVSRVSMANLNYYYFNADDGLRVVRKLQNITGEDSLQDYSYLLYKYPVKINDSWIQDFNNDGFNAGDNLVECISENYLVTVNTEELHCIVYKTSSPEISQNYNLSYVCPGIGLIHQKNFNYEFNSLEEKTLVAYSNE